MSFLKNNAGVIVAAIVLFLGGGFVFLLWNAS